ncbi:MAG: hypothetical protein PQJ35_02385 [Sphaerochaetaceae bacterium]|nr:hypothetical protein [Sphaerochaetaceae bacterium]
MKKTVAILSALLITASLFAVVTPGSSNDFVIKAQVAGKLYHGFSLTEASTSDAVVALLEDSDGNVTKDGIDLESDAAQTIGYYNLYTTENAQAAVSFSVPPLSYTTGTDTYYVPFTLSYGTAAGNEKVSLGDGAIGTAAVATTDEPATVGETVMKTLDTSTGLRWNVLKLGVTFAGTENKSFGLPEAEGDDYYTSTIVASIVTN